MTSLTSFTTRPEELSRVAQNLRDRLEGQTFYSFRVSAGVQMGNGVVEIFADCHEDDIQDATSMAVMVLAHSFA